MRDMRVIVVALGCLVLADAAQAGSGFCTTGEQRVFACSLGGQAVEICAAEDDMGTLRYVQYRYGRVSATFEAPTLDANSLAAVRGWVSNGTGGGAEDMEFRSGPYVYGIEHDWKLRGPRTPAVFYVQKNGKSIRRSECLVYADDLRVFLANHPVLMRDDVHR